MNYLVAKVIGLENSENLTIVEFEAEGDFLYMMSLELPNIKEGMMVKLAIKPLSIAIAKRFSGSFSYSNKLFATVKEVKTGKLLCSVKLDFKGHEFEAVMSNRAIANMHLRADDTVALFIKASDIFIKEIL
ncbi:MAG TPA: transporter [Sulfurospirillum sp. UBA12182]|jgi:molybdopterin-binding protein|nr:MAG TPA: transporter [Sulfurospirillum sp. UBA12182]